LGRGFGMGFRYRDYISLSIQQSGHTKMAVSS
jgi:hypothetical protein